MQYANGDKYDGQWDLDKKRGHGFYYHANGDVEEGDYENDVRIGYHKGIIKEG